MTPLVALLGLAWWAWVMLGLTALRTGSMPQSGRTRRSGWWRTRIRRYPQWQRALALGLVGFLVLPPVGLAAAIPALVVPELRRRRVEREAEAAVVFELPEVIDLFRVGATAGLTMTESARLLARRGHGRVALAFAMAVRKIDRGARVADALDDVVLAGEALRPLVRILVGVDRYGLPLEPGIGEVALLARADRRRRVETAARQVSIRLLVPLVVCVLPAFMLLTVVPSLLTSVGRLRA